MAPHKLKQKSSSNSSESSYGKRSADTAASLQLEEDHRPIAKLHNEVRPHMALNIKSIPDHLAHMFQYRWLKETICEDLDSQQRQLLRAQRTARVYLNHNNMVVQPRRHPDHKQAQAKQLEYALAEERYRKGVSERQLVETCDAYGVNFKPPPFPCDVVRRAAPFKGAHALRILPWRSGPGKQEVDHFQITPDKLVGVVMPEETASKIKSFATLPHALWRQHRFLTPEGFTYKEVKERVRAAQYRTMLAIPKKILNDDLKSVSTNDQLLEDTEVSKSDAKLGKQQSKTKRKSKDKSKSKESIGKSKEDVAKSRGSTTKSKEHVAKHRASKEESLNSKSSIVRKRSVTVGAAEYIDEDDVLLKRMPTWGVTSVRLVSHFNPRKNAEPNDEDELDQQGASGDSRSTLQSAESSKHKGRELFKINERYLEDLVANSIKTRSKLKPIMTPQEVGQFWTNPKEDPNFAKHCLKKPRSIMKVKKAEETKHPTSS